MNIENKDQLTGLKCACLSSTPALPYFLFNIWLEEGRGWLIYFFTSHYSCSDTWAILQCTGIDSEQLRLD